jgi:hypothetical protein
MNTDHANKQAGEAAPTDPVQRGLELARECCAKYANAANWHALEAHLVGMTKWCTQEQAFAMVEAAIKLRETAFPGSTGRAEPALDGVKVVAWLHDHGGFSWPDQQGVDRSRAKQMVLLEDVRAALTGAPDPRMVQVTQEDANNYCRILTALGMEEEGDPVAEVERLRAGAPDPLRLTDEQIADCVTAIKPYPRELAEVPAEQLVAFARRVAALPSPDPLRVALIQAARTNAWCSFGESRAFDAFGEFGPILPPSEIDALARAALAALPSPLEKAAPFDHAHPDSWKYEAKGDPAGLIDGTSSAGSPSDAGADAPPHEPPDELRNELPDEITLPRWLMKEPKP